jgi:putative ABC transport system substrate-binding protein
MRKLIEEAAHRTGLRAIPARAHTPEEIESAFQSLAREHAEAVVILGDALFAQQARQIAGLARVQRMASIFTSTEYAEAGGLMSYGPDLLDHYRRAATFVDKIFKGARPGDLPIEQPTIYYLVINRGAAKAIGVTIPQELLLRADRVIE